MKVLFPLAILFLAMANVNFGQTMPKIEPGVSRELARWRAANYSDVRYKLSLTLEKMSPVLKGSIEVSLKNNADTIVLDWRKIRGKEEFSTVANVRLNGNPAKFEEQAEHLVFRENVRQGENTIALDFTSPIATSGTSITRYVDKEDGAEYIYSLFVPSDASTAFPVFDQPDLKARFSLMVVTPLGLGWSVVSNTKSESLMLETSKIVNHFFEETEPISTYVFAFAAGKFDSFVEDYSESVDSLLAKGTDNYTELYKTILNPSKTKIYVRKSQAEKFKPHTAEVFRLNREGVKFLESYFDYKFPFPKYDLVLIPEFPFGGMEHAGATFLRESSIIFPQEPTANDYISRGNLIFHEAAHQWFGDTVTMRWFDDLWLKEGFAEFMAYKTMEKVLPQYNAWKAFYERNKPLAYLTDSTKGTTPIYQEISNLSSAKSAYGNIVYRKAPSFLRQAEFYLGADKFQTAVRTFLKQNAFKNAEWQDLVKSFETASGENLKSWAESWVKGRGMPLFDLQLVLQSPGNKFLTRITQRNSLKENLAWSEKTRTLIIHDNGTRTVADTMLMPENFDFQNVVSAYVGSSEREPRLVFPNYQDYGYGIFLLDEKSRNYVLANIQNEKDSFLRSMMWGALWDSVREGELDPKVYVELVIKNLRLSGKVRAPTSVQPPPVKTPVYPETDVVTINALLNRVATAMNYYLSETERQEIAPRLEDALRDNVMSFFTPEEEKITVFRAYLNLASTERNRQMLKSILEVSRLKAAKPELKNSPDLIKVPPLRTKDYFDIVTKLLILGDQDAPKLLAELEKTETSDEAKRYAYAARAGIATPENKQKYFADFLSNKEISESYIETAVAPFNSTRHAELTLPFLEKALAELPALKRSRKIFFVNNWLSAFIGGQKSEQALAIVNKFLEENPNLDRDLRLKVLENVDGLERAVKIRTKFSEKK